MSSATSGGGPSAHRLIPNWLLVLLFVSLAANLLVIGSVGAAMWRFRHPPPPPPFGGGPPNLLGYASSLKGERYHAVLDATAAQRERLRPLRQELRAARSDVTAAVTADPFEQAAFEKAQARLIDKENEVRQAALSLYVEIVKNLTPEERRDYQRWRDHRPPPPIGFLEDGGPPEGPPPFPRKRH